MKENIFIFIVVLFILGICVKLYYDSDAYNLKCIISSVDGNTYCVRDRHKLELASDLLANVTLKCKELVLYVGEKYPDNEDVRKLVLGFNPKKICETLPTSEYTAYSEGKGSKLAFCLRKHKHEMKLIDINTLTFVAIHELTHLMTKSIGHKKDFWDNFTFMLEHASEEGLYHSVDYSKHPSDYCGITIDSNPMF